MNPSKPTFIEQLNLMDVPIGTLPESQNAALTAMFWNRSWKNYDKFSRIVYPQMRSDSHIAFAIGKW